LSIAGLRAARKGRMIPAPMMSSAAIGAPAGHVSPSSQLKLTLIPLRRCIGIEGLSQRSGIGDEKITPHAMLFKPVDGIGPPLARPWL
jgi:hypothetical protein